MRAWTVRRMLLAWILWSVVLVAIGVVGRWWLDRPGEGWVGYASLSASEVGSSVSALALLCLLYSPMLLLSAIWFVARRNSTKRGSRAAS